MLTINTGISVSVNKQKHAHICEYQCAHGYAGMNANATSIL